METIERWTTRSDAWTIEDDRHLAEIVLRHIRDGSTQLNAFVEAANLLVRTPAACGYRWNGVVRRHYSDNIKQSKQERKKHTERKLPSRRRTWVPDLEDTTIEGIIRALRQHEHSYLDMQSRNEDLQSKVESLERKISDLLKENAHLRDNPPPSKLTSEELLSEDSKALLAIMERARKLLGVEPGEDDRSRFRMDRNGNLERIVD